MSEKKQNKTKKVNYTKLQVIGLWVLVGGLILFWGGVYVGSQATLASQANEAQIKSQAIEDYKAELKEVQ